MRSSRRQVGAVALSILAFGLNVTTIALIMACQLTETRPGIVDGPTTCGPMVLYMSPWVFVGIVAGPVLHLAAVVFDEPGVAGFAILATIGVGFLLGLSHGWLWFIIAGILVAAWLVRWLNNMPAEWHLD